MKKILLTTAAFIGLATASATTYTPTSEECSSVGISVMTSELIVVFKAKAVFPNPPKTEVLREGDTLNCSDIFISKQKDSTILKAKNDDVLSKLFGYQPIDIGYHDYWKYPAISKDLVVKNIEVNINGTFSTYDLRGRAFKSGDRVSSFFSSFVAGYKLNDGKLQPLVYDYVITPPPALTANDRLEIYVMPHEYNTYQKVVIDKKTSTIEFYKKADFPKE